MSFLSVQRVTVATGVLTAVTAVSVKTGRCVTPSRVHVSAQLAIVAGAVRSAARRVPMETPASRNACVRTTPHAITSQESAHAAPDTLERFELHTYTKTRDLFTYCKCSEDA